MRSLMFITFSFDWGSVACHDYLVPDHIVDWCQQSLCLHFADLLDCLWG